MKFQVGADGASSSQIAVDLTGANVDTVVAGINFGVTTGSQFTTATSIDLGNYQTKFTQGGTVVTMALPSEAYADTGALVSALNADNEFKQNFTAALDDLGKLVVTSKTADAAAITISQDTTTPDAFVDVAVTAGTPATAGFNTAAAAQASILLIDAQITAVSTARAELGAVQNRFESAINTLNVSKENITAAESRIRDTDMAEEMVNYTRANLLSQAGTAMLAQANQSNSGVLQLLQ